MKTKNGKDIKNTEDRTDYERLANMTEEEIVENAKNDPDAPLLTEEELKRFKRVKPRN